MDEDSPIQFVRVTAAAVSTSTRAVTVQAAGAGDEGDPNAGERFAGVEVTQPAGLLASPAITSTAEAVCVRRGDELVALVLVDKGAAAQSIEAGETRLYGVGGDNAAAVIRIRADGSIEITAKSAQDISLAVSGGGDVVLAGGSLKVARDTDPVSVGTWTHIPAAGTGVSPCSLAYTPPGGVSTPITVGAAVTGKITDGAANVKA